MLLHFFPDAELHLKLVSVVIFKFAEGLFAAAGQPADLLQLDKYEAHKRQMY